jgi:hypothetical protein
MGRVPKSVLIGGAIVALALFGLFKWSSEIVDVRYRGPVNLKYFSCTNVEKSSFIKRVCYDRSNSYMVISLNGVYYHYCEIDNGTVASLLKADSMGQFYNSAIKGRFDCRTHRVPNYWVSLAVAHVAVEAARGIVTGWPRPGFPCSGSAGAR